MDAPNVVTSSSSGSHSVEDFQKQVLRLLRDITTVDADALLTNKPSSDILGTSIIQTLENISAALRNQKLTSEADTLQIVLEKAKDKKEYGGLGLGDDVSLSDQDYEDVLFLVEAWLTSLASKQSCRNFLSTVPKRETATRPMTLAQKIFAQHVVGDIPLEGLTAGDVARVGIDWILASELSWQVSTRPCGTSKQSSKYSGHGSNI